MASLLDMPDEVLDIIASYLNGASLGIFAKTHERLMASATRSTKHLRVPTATMELQKLLTYRVTDVRSLDLSNCHSKSRVIQTVIFKCRSITELNIVNCNLSFSQLMNVLKSLKQLEVLNFSFFEPRKNLIASRRKSEFYASSPTIRDIYVESTPSSSLSALTIFLNACVGLKKLHVNLIESCPSLPTSRPNSMALLEIQMWEHLNTVIASFRKSTQPFIPVLLDTLFTTRLERNDLDRWKSMNSACFIYENGNISTLLPTAIQVEGRGSCLRDAYHIQLESQLAAQMTFPWGEPRGLRVDCRTPEAALRAANFFLRPITWSSELRELDLTACHWELPGGDWSNLIESAPVLEAIAIPSCFLPPQEIAENTENTENSRQPKRQRSRYNVLSFLKAIKLKQLFITGDCPHHLDILRPLLTPHNFNGIDKLAHLEELTVQNVDASATIFGALANENVRVVRLCLNGLSNVSKLKEFIQKSVRLKYFKLEAPSLPLGSNLLWDALAQGESLEELCIASRFQERVDISVILKHIPRIVGRVNVLHVHADEAQNRNKLHNAIQGFVGDYRKRNPHRYVKFQSNYSMLSSGRSLCCISNYIAKIKPVGWSLL